MTDKELDKIEARAQHLLGSEEMCEPALQLVAEVRRLRAVGASAVRAAREEIVAFLSARADETLAVVTPEREAKIIAAATRAAATSVRSLTVYHCDHPGCSASAFAGSPELLTEWLKAGQGDLRWYYCGEHSDDAIATGMGPAGRR
jgi:hypothetical protein